MSTTQPREQTAVSVRVDIETDDNLRELFENADEVDFIDGVTTKSVMMTYTAAPSDKYAAAAAVQTLVRGKLLTAGYKIFSLETTGTRSVAGD